MDPSSLMNNPQMQQMAMAMMQDPEIMAMMQTPGMMEKLQAAMTNPAAAASDPDVMKIASKLQGLGMGGGGGGLGGGMGGFGGMPAAQSNAAPPANIKHITTPSQFSSLLSSSGDRLVVIDYFTTWCGPCKAIAPLFNELAHKYVDKVVFVKVDGDQSRDLCLQHGIQGFPTFEFYVRGQKMESFSGADREKLQRIVEEYGEYVPPPPPCPYKHFPLKETELVKYPDMKWEMVAPKFREINAKFPLGDTHILTETELKAVDSLIKTVQDKSAYHSSSVPADQFAVLNKLLSWPQEHIGPVINSLRIAVFHPVVAKYYADEANKKGANDLIPILLKIAHSSEKHVTAMLVIRTLVNGFSRRVLGKAIGGRYEDVIESVAGLYKKFTDENLRLSIIALYINYAILFSEDPKFFEQAKVLMLTSVQEALQEQPFDRKITYRLDVILGTLFYQDAAASELGRDLDVLEAANAAAKDKACAADQPTQQVTAELALVLKAK